MNILKKTSVILFLILFLGFFIRIYKIDEFPVHLGHDEISQLYDAISIAKTGKDIYGAKLPFVFRSVNDFKPPFYTYATAASYLIFDWNEFTIRIPGVIFGTVVIVAVYFFARSFLKDKRVAVASAFLAALSPFEIFYSRKSFESQAGVDLILFGFALVKKGFDKKANKYIYLGFILIGLSCYVHFSQAVMVPLLLIAFLLMYRKKFLAGVAKGLLVFLITVLPLVFLTVRNSESLNRLRAVSVFQDPKVEESLGRLKIANVRRRETVRFFVAGALASQKYLNHLMPSYLFLNGLDLTSRKYVDVGIFYPVQFLFLILGLFYLVREKGLERSLIFVWILLSILPSAFTFEDTSPHRSILAYTFMEVVMGAGIVALLTSFKKYKRLVFLALTVIFVYSFVYFWEVYTVDFPIEKSHFIMYPFKYVSEYVWNSDGDYKTIVIDPKFGPETPAYVTGPYYYLAFYGKQSTGDFQSSYQVNDKMFKIKNIEIRAVFWPKDKDLKNALVIASPWSLPVDIKDSANVIKTFYYYKSTKPAFYAIKL